MTKEEQRFTAAVAAMNGLLANNSFIFNMNNDDKPDCDNLLSYAIDCADTLIKELDNDSKKASIGISDLPYIESFPSKNRNSKKTPDPITEPSMNSIGDIKLRK